MPSSCNLPCFISAMAFSCERPVVSLAAPGEVNTFVADVFKPRPSFDEMARFQAWGNEAGEKMRKATDRDKCAVSWVQLVVDQHGFLAILKFRQDIQLCHAKSAAKALLNFMPVEARRSLQLGLRPLDEVDRDRIMAWETLESLRPKRPRQEEEEEEGDEDEVKLFFKRRRTEETADAAGEDPVPPAEQPKKKTAAELLAELASESESEAEAVEQPRLMLTGAAAPSPSTIALPDTFDPASVWEFRAKQEATIVFAEAGARPESLKFIRCHREDRRQLLLQGRVKQEFAQATLLTVVRVAMKLAEDGKIPGIGKHGRRSEFMERCSTALSALNPNAERVVARLPSEVQALICSALGGDGPAYDGCFNLQCLDMPAAWVRVDDELSHCARCKWPMSIGRTVNSLRDILGPRFLCALKSEPLGHRFQSTAGCD